MTSDPPPDPPPASGLKKALGFLAAAGVVLFKFGAKLKFLLLPALKFLPLVLKTGGSMVLTIGAYSMLWGWKYAVGFVLLILVHELGHLVAARNFGLAVGAPVFIPFMGAFIALRNAPKNAWIESWVGIGGPLLGSLGALVCHGAGAMLDIPLLIALGWSAYWLNLFNLVPIGQLDGGRIATALSPWLWVPGFGIMGYLAWTRPNIIVILLLVLALPRLFSLFRKRTPEEERFYEITPARRLTMGALYFGLIAALLVGMEAADTQLQHLHGQENYVASR
jgi:Zn-dependent protease